MARGQQAAPAKGDPFDAKAARLIAMARAVIEADPKAYGEVQAGGIRSQGDLDFAAEAAGRRFEEVGAVAGRPTDAAAAVPATVFTSIAYNHPFFDGNKRTAFLAAMATAAALGFQFRKESLEGLPQSIIAFAAKNTPTDEVAGWFLGHAIRTPTRAGVRDVSVPKIARHFAAVIKALA